MFSWLLTFGDKVELLEPEGLREEIRLLAENIGKKYKKN
ncbi:WYL domain-containing protein [[Clostridium] scindens]|nr:WYL domain-containing protein [[Clostridium] scindens]MEE0648915.1 WYL domain-containing protein [[Clostridium] scindens]